MHPDELLDQLKASAGARKARNLDIIHVACREQSERGSKDFSVATISKIAQERGGPVKSTIHNKTGDDFKGLIKAWADHSGGMLRKIRKTSENPIYSVLDKIPDPAVRAVMGAVLAENRQLRGEVNLLKAHYSGVVDQRVAVATRSENPSIQILQSLTDLFTSVEKDALRHAFSDGMLRDESWSLDIHGRVINGKGRSIFKIGFATAIQKLVKSLDSSTLVVPNQDMKP